MKADAIRHPFPTLPEPGQAIPVADGIFWLRMPLPFKLDHINLWLLEDGDGWTVVDTGLARDEVKALWQRLFAGVMAGRPVRRVLCTHFHPDHLGLAGWLTEQWEAPLWATLGEWAMGRMLSLDTGGASLPGFRAFYRAAGFNPGLMELVEQRGNPYPTRVSPIPPSYRRLRDGERIDIGGRAWTVIVGTGHSPEHACLWCAEAGVLISGDQILPRISPNVSVWPQEPAADPLRLFLASLDRFSGLAEDTLVLPSHDVPFTGLDARLAQLAHHHDGRLGETVAACTEPATALDVLRRLFVRELDNHQLFFAIGETLAHLHYLEGEGRVRRSRGPDGTDLYRST